MPAYARITSETLPPFNGTAIFLNGRNIPYESCSTYSQKLLFNEFHHIVRFLKLRRNTRKLHKLNNKYLGLNTPIEENPQFNFLNNQIRLAISSVKSRLEKEF